MILLLLSDMSFLRVFLVLSIFGFLLFFFLLGYLFPVLSAVAKRGMKAFSSHISTTKHSIRVFFLNLTVTKQGMLMFLLALPAGSAYAEMPPLRGTLRFTDGTPVAFATVVVKDERRHALTDDDGRFRIVGLREGSYELEVSSVEIENRTFRVELASGSAPLSLEVEAARHEIGEVAVVGQTTKSVMQTRGFAVDIVETGEVALHSTQTLELLDRTAGVRIRQDGGLGSRHRLSINGFSGNAVKIFIDGVPERNYGSSFSLTSIPPSLIERVEVYKGVVPGHLAEDALGGAVNVVLKKRKTRSLTTSYSVGSFNTHQWNGAGSFRLRNGLTVDASGFYNYSDNSYKVWGDNIYFKNYKGTIIESDGRKVRRFNDAYRSWGGKAGVGFTDVRWADRFMLGAVFSDDYKEVQNGATMAIVYGNRHYRRRAKVATLNYEKASLLLRGLDLKLEASYSDLRRENVDTVGIRYGWDGPIRYPDGSYVLYNSGAEANSTRKTRGFNDDRTLMLRTNLSYRLDDQTRLHASYLFNDFDRSNHDPYLPVAEQHLRDTRDLRKQVLAATIERAFWGDHLQAGIFYKHYWQRVELNEPSYDSASRQYLLTTTRRRMDESGYGLTLSYRLIDGLHLLASAERALRLPSENELFGNTTQDINAAPDLEPEESRNVNLGIDAKRTFGPHALGANVMVYYRDTRNMIREVFSAREEWSAFANLESTETKGIDAELFYNYARSLEVRFSLSRFDVLYNTKYDPNGHVYNYYRTQIPNEPSFKFNANAAYTLHAIAGEGSRLTLHYNLGYVRKFLRNWSNVGSANLQQIPTQIPMDAGVTFFFPGSKVALNFDVKNLADRQIYDNYGLQKPGRSFHAKVTYFIL